MLVNKLKNLNHRLLPRKVLHSPEWLILGVNNICNLHCKMCDVGLKINDTNFAVNLTGTKPINMPLELIKKAIDDVASYNPKIKLGYAFTEPMIYPHLMESLKYADKKGIFTSVTTNALNLKLKAEELASSGLNELNISLDGPQEIHNEIRGHKSSFQRAIEGIEKLLETDTPPTISIFCVITEWNIGHLVEFIDQIKHLPLKRVGFMHTNFITKEMAEDHNLIFGNEYHASYSNTEEIDIKKMDLELLLKEIKQIKTSEFPFPISFSPEISTKSELENFYYNPQNKIGSVCNDVFRNIMLKSDGTVIPAHGRCYNLTIGNLYDSSLKEVWNSAVISRFRDTLIKNKGLLPACTRCCSAF